MKYINLSGYPLRVEGQILPVEGHAKVREVDVGDAEELHYEGMQRPEDGTVIILPPEADEYGSPPTHGHALPDDMSWDATDRVFDCELDIYMDTKISEEELDRMEQNLDAMITRSGTSFQIHPEVNYMTFGEPPRREVAVSKPTFAEDLFKKLDKSANQIFRDVDDRLEELCSIYQLDYIAYHQVVKAFKANLGPERLTHANTNPAFVDNFFYNHFKIDGRAPQPTNSFQPTLDKEQ